MRSPWPCFVISAYDDASKPAFFKREMALWTPRRFYFDLSQPNPTGGFSAMQRPPACGDRVDGVVRKDHPRHREIEMAQGRRVDTYRA